MVVSLWTILFLWTPCHRIHRIPTNARHWRRKGGTGNRLTNGSTASVAASGIVGSVSSPSSYHVMSSARTLNHWMKVVERPAAHAWFQFGTSWAERCTVVTCVRRLDYLGLRSGTAPRWPSVPVVVLHKRHKKLNIFSTKTWPGNSRHLAGGYSI